MNLHIARLALISFSMAGLSFGSTIVSTLGPLSGSAPGIQPLNNPLTGIDALAVEWSQSSSWTNVSVTAAIFSQSVSSSIDAWVTDSAGDVLFSDLNDTVGISNPGHLQTFFSNIALGPGTYYLLIASPTTTTNAGWAEETGNTPVSTSADATYLGSFSSYGTSIASPLAAHPGTFPGGSANAPAFSISGDSSASTPEPATVTLLLGALAGIFLLKPAKRSC